LLLHGPGFPVAVDQDIRKGRTGGRVKQLDLRPKFDQHVVGHGGRPSGGPGPAGFARCGGRIGNDCLPRIRFGGLHYPVRADAPLVHGVCLHSLRAAGSGLMPEAFHHARSSPAR
jgi:hypothetical protein